MSNVLRATYEPAASAAALAEDPEVLAWFEFGPSPLASTDPRHVPVALAPLDPDPRVEVWRTCAPVEHGVHKHVRFARNGQFTMGHIVVDLREQPGVGDASRIAYARLQAFLAESAHPWPLKIWNYLPGINVGEGDFERYRQFCVGRAEAVAAHYDEQPVLPAATAIGTPAEEPALQVYFLAGALPGINVENPRQVNAWRYPRRYGPRSPLFSRGTVLEAGGGRQFLISGTASVVGHEMHHQEDVRSQARESWRNVEALMGEAHRLLGREKPGAAARGVLKVYVRRGEDRDAVRETLGALLPPGLPRILLAGDICRADLLTEVDGIVDLD